MENLRLKWTSGNGPRIGCVRDYPDELQFRALEQIHSLEKPESEIRSKEPEDSCIDLSRNNSKSMLDTILPFQNPVQDFKPPDPDISNHNSGHLASPGSSVFFSPRPTSELNAAASKIQRIYTSYRTRRNLGDSAVVGDEWQALDESSVSLFDVEKSNSAISRWARARTRAAKVGKGLANSEKYQKLALQHWLEAIDPRHRYGANLQVYYDRWFQSESTQPFFYWLDVGDGKEYDLENCPRSKLQHQCIKYLGPNERKSYEVIIENGKLVYRQSGLLLETTEGFKWIFVLSTSKNLYVGKHQKGLFTHSSFLAGGATLAAGRLVAHAGILEAVWPYSAYYRPTEDAFQDFISFLEESHVDISSVQVRRGMEMKSYEVIVENGKLVYRQSRLLVDTTAASHWFFVLRSSKNLYVGENQNDVYEQSGYLAGGATTAAGRLVARGGVLEAVWPYTGGDLPTEDNYMEFISFLVENHIDVTNVKIRMTFRALLICTSKLL